MGRKRVYRYYATYMGVHRKMTILGIGIIKPRVEFEVLNEKIWYGLVEDPNFKTRKGYSYKNKK